MMTKLIDTLNNSQIFCSDSGRQTQDQTPELETGPRKFSEVGPNSLIINKMFVLSTRANEIRSSAKWVHGESADEPPTVTFLILENVLKSNARSPIKRRCNTPENYLPILRAFSGRFSFNYFQFHSKPSCNFCLLMMHSSRKTRPNQEQKERTCEIKIDPSFSFDQTRPICQFLTAKDTRFFYFANLPTLLFNDCQAFPQLSEAGYRAYQRAF